MNVLSFDISDMIKLLSQSFDLTQQQTALLQPPLFLTCRDAPRYGGIHGWCDLLPFPNGNLQKT